MVLNEKTAFIYNLKTVKLKKHLFCLDLAELGFE